MSHVENCEALINFLTFDCGTGREPEFHHNLILLDVVSDHAFLRSNLKKSGDIEQTEAFNIDRSAELINAVVAMWVNFLHCCALIELIRVNDGVDFLISPPVHEISKHQLHLGEVELPGATKSQQIMLIEMQLLQVSYLGCLNPFFELHHNLIHLRRCVTHKSSLDGLFWLRTEESHLVLCAISSFLVH